MLMLQLIYILKGEYIICLNFTLTTLMVIREIGYHPPSEVPLCHFSEAVF